MFDSDSPRLPFKGITFCPTGLGEVLNETAKSVVKLGGDFSGNLTQGTRVLLVGDDPQLLMSKKYAFAVKYRTNIVFVHYSTVRELLDIWKTGNDITGANRAQYRSIKNETLRMLHVLKDRYSAKPLISFAVFIGRLSDPDPDLVQRLEDQCRKMGCSIVHTKQFITDVAIRNPTKHVIFVTDNANSTRARAAADYGIPLVHYKWVLDCYRRGATLQFDPHYLLENIPLDTPFEDIGSEVCNSFDQELDLPALPPQKYDQDGEMIVAPVPAVISNKSKAQAAKLWERAVDKPDIQATREGTPQDDDGKFKFKRETKPELPSPSHDQGIFHGCIFYIHSKFGTHRSQILEKVIVKAGGIVEESDTPPITHIIVPSDAPLDTLHLGPHDLETHVVTDFFIERCLHYHKLISPPDSWCTPLLENSNFAITPSDTLKHNDDGMLHVSITGFYGVELLHLKKIIEMLRPMGMCFSEYLNTHSDLLVLNISSLTTIPKTHPLWTNEYGNLLEENNRAFTENPTSIDNSTVFRDSMKRKLGFAKDPLKIPVVSPGFIMALLDSTHGLKERTGHGNKVTVNSQKWCIWSPKNCRNGFHCDVRYIDAAERDSLHSRKSSRVRKHHDDTSKPSHESHKHQKPEHKVSRVSSSSFSSAKSMAKDVLDTIQNASAAQMKQTRKRMQRQSSGSRVKQESPQKTSSSLPAIPVMKRPKLSMAKKIEPVSRTGSWGTMMSTELERTGEGTVDVPVIVKREQQLSPEREIAYTQITYGVTHDTSANANPPA